jgi:chromosome segregation ATPase
MVFEQRQGRDGFPYWEATFKLPFEWSPALMLVGAVFRRLSEEVTDLSMKVEELKGLYADVEETLEKLTGLAPRSLRRLKKVVAQLSRLAKALEEIEEEEEEEEEEEW